MLEFTPAGFMGIDPFPVPKSPIAFPTIDWGFEQSSCWVDKDHAAKRAYEVGDPDARVFYKIRNPNKDQISHCSFTDKGCPLCKIDEAQSQLIRIMIGETSKKFVAALESGIFAKSAFEINSTANVTLFVNVDQVLRVARSSYWDGALSFFSTWLLHS
jgi:hypothetical protein